MKNIPFSLLLILSASLLVACGGDDDDDRDPVQDMPTASPVPTESPAAIPTTTPEPDPDPTPTTTPEPAPDAEVITTNNLSTGTISVPKFAYYDLETASELMLTEEEAETNTDWDIAFRRTAVYLNTAAEPAVSLYFLDNVDELYNAEGRAVVDRFINATAETELPLFENLAVVIPEDDAFSTDTEELVIGDNFFEYDPVNHVVSADADAYFIVDSDGELAQFVVTDLTTEGRSMASITMSVGIQAADQSEFAVPEMLTVEAAACTDEGAFIDFGSLDTVAADGEWDISIPCTDGLMNFEIHIADDAQAINDSRFTEVAGISAENKPFFPWLDNIVTVLAYVDSGDERSTYGWGEYGVNGENFLWPNYAAYIIRTPTADYKFQVIGYYDTEDGASGAYSIRHQLIVPTGTE